MTATQRRVHVWMWLVLGPAAVAGLVLAVVLRPIQPVQDGALPGVDPAAQSIADPQPPEDAP